MSPSPIFLPAQLGTLVRDEMERLEVPGVAIGVFYDGAVYAEGFGVTNHDHPAAVTSRTPFQIGSTSKTFTATVLMQELEAGRIDLDARVRDYLPGFKLQSEEDAEVLTIRHLATHHGGWSGDFFRETGRGEDALAKLVAKMARSPQIVPAGTAFSYNNAGFYVLGHVLEAVTGRVFEELVTDRVLRPLQLDRSFYFPEEVINLGPAAGHIRTPGGPVVAMPYHMARGTMPGGGIISTVLDQLRYAAFHLHALDPGASSQVLSPQSIDFMQEPLAEAGSMCDAIGLSWMLDDLDGEKTVKHGGATNGQLSSFELVPAQRFACTVLTNADSGRELRDTVAAAAREHFLGSRPAVERGEFSPPNLEEYEGVYRATLSEPHVSVTGGAVYVEARTPARVLERRPLTSPGDPPVRLSFYAPDRAVIMDPPRRGERCEFVRDETGTVVFIRWDGRLARRVFQ
jgi:CubicO group peptidase (beta-lactamase class C family)